MPRHKSAPICLKKYRSGLFRTNDETLSGNITANRTLVATTVYKQEGCVTAKIPATLTVPAGTLLPGMKTLIGGGKSVLIVEKGIKLNINGPVANPVIFVWHGFSSDTTKTSWFLMIRLLVYLLFFVLSITYTSTHAQAPSTIKTYYKNGRIKAIVHQGYYNSCGVPVGIDTIYSRTGGLIKTIAYEHTLAKGKGCHELSTKRTLIFYYKNGRRKAEQYFVGCYECEPSATGTWKWYSEDGKIIRLETKTK
jgi:hypothetical protein